MYLSFRFLFLSILIAMLNPNRRQRTLVLKLGSIGGRNPNSDDRENRPAQIALSRSELGSSSIIIGSIRGRAAHRRKRLEFSHAVRIIRTRVNVFALGAAMTRRPADPKLFAAMIHDVATSISSRATFAAGGHASSDHRSGITARNETLS